MSLENDIKMISFSRLCKVGKMRAMPHKTTISIPDHIHRQIKLALERGEATTMNQLIQFALSDYFHRRRAERWNDETFSELEAGLLRRHNPTGVLLSRQFRRDAKKLLAEKRDLWRWLNLVFRKITGHKLSLKQVNFEVYELDLANYYLAKFDLAKCDLAKFDLAKCDHLELLFRRDQNQIIACRLGRYIMRSQGGVTND